MQKYGGIGEILHPPTKKMRFFAKIMENLLVIQKIVVPLCRVKELTQPPGRVSGKKQKL